LGSTAVSGPPRNCGEQGQEEHAQAEDPGEDAANDDVVGPAAIPERPDADGNGDGGREQAEPQVNTGRERSTRTGIYARKERSAAP
jgi:hypothetical protein